MIDKNILDAHDGDVYLYHGGISHDGYSTLTDVLERADKTSPNVCLVLNTYGGDPNAGYRIARALNHHYENVEILIPSHCKSAGTLVCIGAHKLIFGDRGELGPLDIQLSKPDELFESMSGLDMFQALSALETQVLGSFRKFLMDIRGGSRLRTKLAADIAAKLADGFVQPIMAKFDPVTLGEHQRAVQIAMDYGERLDQMTKSLKPNALSRLITGYPSHAFVIDRKEAAELFNNVEAPTNNLLELYYLSLDMINKLKYSESPFVLNLNDLAQPENESYTETEEEHHGDEEDADSTVSEPELTGKGERPTRKTNGKSQGNKQAGA